MSKHGIREILLRVVLLACASAGIRAQCEPDAQASATPIIDNTNAKLETMAKLLTATQHQLEETQQQLNELRTELEQLRHPAASIVDPSVGSSSSAGALAEEVERLQQEQEVVQAEVKQHDQTKLESISKYPVRVYGLLLFNAFSNAGVVDNADLPSLAFNRTPGQSHGSIGGSFRQTLLGLLRTAAGSWRTILRRSQYRLFWNSFLQLVQQYQWQCAAPAGWYPAGMGLGCEH